MKSRLPLLLLSAALLTPVAPVEAASKRPILDQCNYTNEGRVVCMGKATSTREPIYSRRQARAQQNYESAARRRTTSRRYADANGNVTIIGGRPAGCPTRYCGCGLSLRIFKKIIPELNLAWNWPKYFPRTAPAPDMVAARPGHVMGLISHVRGNYWRVYDANSGRGLTRIHVRSIAGYVVVDPHGARRIASSQTTSVYSARGHVTARAKEMAN